MFNNLYKLFKSSSQNEPLEDFTTELLAGLLRSDPSLCKRFCQDFLAIPGEQFSTRTQVYYPKIAAEENNSFVDLVIESSEAICFIENKVEAKEGGEQLARYAQVLNTMEAKKTFLRYCTKNHDPKEEFKPLDKGQVQFSQYQWHELATFLKPFRDQVLVDYFISFLENHNMYFDMKLQPADLLAMENWQRVHIWINTVIDRARIAFNERFKSSQDPRYKNEFNEQILNHNRYCIYRAGIIAGGESEILYAIDLNGQATVQIYLNLKHEAFKEFEEAARAFQSEGFDFELLQGSGARLVAHLNLATLINDEGGEIKLQEWFTARFEELTKFIAESSAQKLLSWQKDLRP